MLDLSAAFDTVDHDITGDALDWFRSYLTGRIQRVVIENAVSGDQELGFGVPQSPSCITVYCFRHKCSVLAVSQCIVLDRSVQS